MNVRTMAGRVHGRQLRRARASVTTLFVAGALLTTACGGDFHLSAGNFSISPNPAVPGDMVVASFILNLLPAQRHTMVVYINDEEHLRVTVDDAPQNPVMIDLGDAADLIAEYGTGDHVAYVLIEANSERARTQGRQFTLNPAPEVP